MRKLYQVFFQHYWNPYITVALAGILSAFYFYLTKTVWAVTGEFTRFGGAFLSFFGISISDWKYFQLVNMDGTTFTRTDGWLIWGMFLGALGTVLLGNHFSLRFARQKRRYIQGFTGGFISGFGARLALGCNLAAFFTGIPQFSFHAWIFMITTAIGTYIGVTIVQTKFWKGKPRLVAKGHIKRIDHHNVKRKKRNLQPWLGGVVIIALLFIVIILWFQEKPKLAIAALFGACFGILIERGQICFTSAFRDLWISGRGVMLKALSIGMMLSTGLTFIFIQRGIQPIIQVATPGTAIGGLLFGIGIVLAGGCETGWMYRAMEGQVYFWIVGIGNILGATFLAFAWDHLFLYSLFVEGWEAVNILESWGILPAFIATLSMLISLFFFAHWWEKHYHFNLGFQRKK